MSKKAFFFLIVILPFVALALAACSATPPAPDSDSKQSFAAGSTIPVDHNVYRLAGEVVADIENLQTVNGRGSGAYYNGYGSSSFAIWNEGKGFVRVKILSIDPAWKYASVGDSIIIKTTDQKVMALLPGDKVTFKCRAQYEAVAATENNEAFDSEKYKTWEFDFCRLEDPKIGEAH